MVEYENKWYFRRTIKRISSAGSKMLVCRWKIWFTSNGEFLYRQLSVHRTFWVGNRWRWVWFHEPVSVYSACCESWLNSMSNSKMAAWFLACMSTRPNKHHSGMFPVKLDGIAQPGSGNCNMIISGLLGGSHILGLKTSRSSFSLEGYQRGFPILWIRVFESFRRRPYWIEKCVWFRYSG